MKPLLLRWSALPRAARWATLAVLAVAAYFVLVEPSIDGYNRYASQADANESSLRRFEAAKDEVRRAGDTTLIGVKHFGVVSFPGDAEAQSLALNQAIDEILKRNGVEGHTSTTRTVPMGRGPLSEKVSQTYRLERLTKTVDFTASPEAVAWVIADLEQTPVVSTISNVVLKQVESRDRPGRVISASLTVETWVLAKKGATR